MERITLLILLLITSASCEQSLTSNDIVNKSVQFHDPLDRWSSFNQQLDFDEYRADGVIRKTHIKLDLPNTTYQIHREGQYQFSLANAEFDLIDGEIDTSRAEVIKNYYLYLWGLPMKLKDTATPLGSWVKSSWQDKPSYEVEVNYEKDTWYFHFDPETYEMMGYKFFTDSAKTKGETILLQGLMEVGSLKIPKERSWYTIPENKYLGKDILVNYQ
jgi:hypothetical protein